MSISDKIKDFFGKTINETEALKGNVAKDKYFFSEKEFPRNYHAVEEFRKSKNRLFDVNSWSKISHPLSANFSLHNQSAEGVVEVLPQLNYYIAIDLPGPLPIYWVKVIDIKNADSFAEFTVQPSEDPTKNTDKEKTQHFFQKGATSTFRVEINDNKIKASEIGKNEAINVKSDEAGIQAPINALVAETGWNGFQKIQWENLCKYIVGNKI